LKTSNLLLLAALGVGGYLLYRWMQQQAVSAAVIPTGTSPQDALTAGLQAGIAAGTYDANALRAATLSFGPGQTGIAGYRG
jgi:hypothetical protein